MNEECDQRLQGDNKEIFGNQKENNDDNKSEHVQHVVIDKRPKKNTLIPIVIILVIIVGILKMCGGGLSEEDVFAYSDHKGTEVPVIVNHINYNESFYVGFMDVTLDIENITENDYREMTFVALAWDKDGFPIAFNYTDDPYPYLMDCDNLRALSTDQPTWQHAEYYEIAYMSVFLAECTDFNGETWENPVMKYVDEHKGEKLEDTQLAYYVFE